MDNKTKYLVSDDRGEFVIELPADWKITFGFVNPAIPSGDYRGGRSGHCLRVYEGKALRAVLGNVTAVRDLSIPFARKVEKQTGSAQWTSDSLGNFEANHKVNVDHDLVLEAGDDMPF